MVKDHGFRFHAVEVSPRAKGISPRNFMTATRLMAAVVKARGLLAQIRPDVVIGMGGYVSLPATLAASTRRIPLVIHEQNAILSMGNRVVARWADAIATSFSETARVKRETVTVGNPIRAEIASVRRTPEARRAAAQMLPGDLDADRKTILIFGGSQGARQINSAMVAGYERWRERSDLQVLHVCGRERYGEVTDALDEIQRETDPLTWVAIDYLDGMEDAYRLADLAVTRSGATTIAELQATGIPAVLVPWPHALDDDQRLNAAAVADADAAVVIEDSDAPSILAETVAGLIDDQDALKTMSDAIRAMAKPDAASRLADVVESVAGSRGPSEVVASREGWPPNWRSAHLVGIGGHGLSAIARILVEMGVRVSGSDLQPSPILEELQAIGADVSLGHEGSRVTWVDVVVRTAAAPDSNPELQAAEAQGIPILSRAEAMARLVADLKLVGVSGTHGKTTTSAMVATIFDAAGTEPTWLVGSNFTDGRPRARKGKGPWAVVEADEAYGTFLHLYPTIAVVTNLEDDHLDHYGTPEMLEAAFVEFCDRAELGVVVCADDPRSSNLVSTSKQVVTYGFAESSDMRIDKLELGREGSRFELVRSGESIGEIELNVPGRHNALNAAGAAAAGLMAGLEVRAVLRGLGSFRGTGRRFERKGSISGARVVADYAHMPAEVEAALHTARLQDPARLFAVFQPHMVSRTKQFHEDFGESLKAADVVVVSDIDAAREPPDPEVTGKLVADSTFDASPGKRIVYLPTLEQVADYIKSEAAPGDLFVTMGCGTIGRLPSMVLVNGTDGSG